VKIRVVRPVGVNHASENDTTNTSGKASQYARKAATGGMECRYRA
jgi:hypothetical protein